MTGLQFPKSKHSKRKIGKNEGIFGMPILGKLGGFENLDLFGKNGGQNEGG